VVVEPAITQAVVKSQREDSESSESQIEIANMQNRADTGEIRCGNKIKQESEKRTPRVSADSEVSDVMVASVFSQFMQRPRNMGFLRFGEKRARSGSSHLHTEAD